MVYGQVKGDFRNHSAKQHTQGIPSPLPGPDKFLRYQERKNRKGQPAHVTAGLSCNHPYMPGPGCNHGLVQRPVRSVQYTSLYKHCPHIINQNSHYAQNLKLIACKSAAPVSI